MKIKRIGDESLKHSERAAIARYRHKVFVQSLRWELPGTEQKQEREQDEFDADCAIHIVASNDEGLLTGYGRLLPTTQNYLLAAHFPYLVERRALPCTPITWELSRFTSTQVSGDPDDLARQRTLVGKRILLEAVRFVVERSGREIVFCTSVAIERLALRWGVDLERLGTPRDVGGTRLVAALIHCNAQTIDALAGRPDDASAAARVREARAEAALA